MNSIMDNKKNPRTFVECNTGTCHDCILYFHNLKAVNCERRLYLIQKEKLIWSDDEGWIRKDSLKKKLDQKMKEGLVKITGEDNLYYDSITKQYKSAMHCPNCGKYSGCWCFPDEDSLPLWEEDYPNTYCSDRCFVLDSQNDCIKEIALALKITITPKMEEWNASKIVREFMLDGDLDCDISGSICEV